MEKEKVCKHCKRFVKEDVCPVCNKSDFTRTWKGVIIINDPAHSEFAKLLGITAPGKYAIWVK